MIPAGAATVDITPPAGLAMCGFAVRTKPATGSHDPLTVRALAVGDTALAVADVLGLDSVLTGRIRQRCVLPEQNVIVCALHNHGGPVSMPGRFTGADDGYMRRLEDACVAAIDQAVAAQQPASLVCGAGGNPDVARNRRRADGPVDHSLPVLRVRDAGGKVIAVVVNYACHPVVLGADNLLWTADYPHFVRQELEAAYPDAVALFVTGFIGDVNPGHSPEASLSLEAQPGRDYPTAAAVGAKIAAAALQAPEEPLGDTVRAAAATVQLRLHRLETQPTAQLAAQWEQELATAGPMRAAVLRVWLDWAAGTAQLPLRPLEARVAALDWGGLPVVGLPGEIFTATGLGLRSGRSSPPAILAGFAADNPGYIPPQEEYQYGGYEVEEAYRYYGQPASFAPGSAEALAAGVQKLLA